MVNLLILALSGVGFHTPFLVRANPASILTLKEKCGTIIKTLWEIMKGLPGKNGLGLCKEYKAGRGTRLQPPDCLKGAARAIVKVEPF